MCKPTKNLGERGLLLFAHDEIGKTGSVNSTKDTDNMINDRELCFHHFCVVPPNAELNKTQHSWYINIVMIGDEF